MGLYHRYEPQAKAFRLNGKSERLAETLYFAYCCTLYIDDSILTQKTEHIFRSVSCFFIPLISSARKNICIAGFLIVFLYHPSLMEFFI